MLKHSLVVSSVSLLNFCYVNLSHITSYIRTDYMFAVIQEIFYNEFLVIFIINFLTKFQVTNFQWPTAYSRSTESHLQMLNDCLLLRSPKVSLERRCLSCYELLSHRILKPCTLWREHLHSEKFRVAAMLKLSLVAIWRPKVWDDF
jgi:hypothetical protein